MNVVAGRCLTVDLKGTQGSLQLCSVHLPPHFSVPAKKEFLSCVSRALDPRHATVFIGGDWNFCELGEARQHVDPSLDRTPSGSLASEFGRYFHRYTEIGQDNHTH
eukprot:9470283-Pyramimonas_sp.AAC.1